MTTYQKFAPVLVYLVEMGDGFYSHPDWEGITAGQTAWFGPSIQFSNHMDASAHAKKVGGRVIKLRVSANQEAVKSSVKGEKP